MPKKTQPIPEWIKTLEYPAKENLEEFAYQIFLRRCVFNGTWKVNESYKNNDKVKTSIKKILSEQTLLRDSFETLKTAAPQINIKNGKPILTSVMQRENPLTLALSGLSHFTETYIPNGTPIIGINLQHSNDEILGEIKQHLNTLRSSNLSLNLFEDDLIAPDKKQIINDIYLRPIFYIEKWYKEKTLQAFDLALWRDLTRNAITITEIVNFLDFQDDSQWRKTVLKRIDEMMLPSVADAIICGIA